jgi:hypothetical protein
MLGGVVYVACSCNQRAPSSPSHGSGPVGQAAPAIAVAPAPASAAVSAPTDAGADAPEPVGVHFRCASHDPLFEPGRIWTEERTSSATAVGPGGYMGQAWKGVKTSEQRLEKKILAMEGENVTRMRVRFLIDRDPEHADKDAPNHRTPYEGKTAILARREGEVDLEAETTPDRSSIELLRGRESELVPEMTGPRWRGDAPALAKTFRTIMGWRDQGVDREPPWGTAVLAATIPPAGSPFTDGRAFSVTGDARDESAALGHGGVWKIHVTGTLEVNPEGALLESRLTTRSVLTERLNHDCGRDQNQPCPWSVSLTTTTTTSFRVICDR